MSTIALRPAQRTKAGQVAQQQASQPALDATPQPTAAAQSTSDYGRFRAITSNREVNEPHVRKLMANIRKENLLHLRPIDVTEKFEVVDGQHRLEAAERLGLPIYYQLSPALNQGHIAVLNSVSRSWTGQDYLNHFTVEGREHYQRVSKFLQQHSRFGLDTALNLLSLDSRGNTQAFRAGDYRITRWEKGILVAAFVEELHEKFGFAYAFTNSFVAALDQAVRTGRYDHAKMLRQVEKQPRALVRCPTQRASLEMIEELYNYQQHGTSRVRFR
jgi:hypothetical protein